ncbi:lamin tail domain-containing protein [Lewinella sp. JB7]|uniref:lamin tail domain-containing protein n=1 Tax=Lewinella sp. JB7 TaxID=2962887 RepID=UPI0020CA07AE|nr:lamin tail domain-containing protein [Lewinella sp. JB7]MCP9237500.1 lamin tail domain-containing protein [Lewinella sp. JB7]
MRYSYPLFWLLLFAGWPGTRAPAQDTLFYQSFEGSPDENLPFTTDVNPYGTGSLPTWNTVERIRGIDGPTTGSLFWAARDVDNAISGRAVSRLTFDPGEICNLTRARFVFDYNVVGYDGGDDFGYELYLDGFLDRTEVLVDGQNGGGVSTLGWISDTVTIPGTAQTARLVLFFDQNGDDVAGIDNVRVIATGQSGSCAASCGIRLGEPTANCASFTDGADDLRVVIPYSGAETGVVVNIPGAESVGGDDPALYPDGRIEATGLREGNSYELEVSGGDCALRLPLEFPTDQCAPSDLVINEVLASPAEDVNGDGVVSPADEFVEIYNAGTEARAVGGHTLHDASNSGSRYTFPAGAELAPGESFTIFAGAGTIGEECNYGTANGFLGLNDRGEESVILRDGRGRVVAQVDFTDAPAGESLSLFPDGNLDGGYHAHSTRQAGTTSSPCTQQAMPVTLLSFTATSLHDAVRLDWTTAYEADNREFTVERSKAGVSYETVGRVPAGDGTYVLIDHQPFPGQNLYRLRQVDHDGTETTFGPVLVRLDSGLLRLYPNPTTGKLRLSGEVGHDERVTVYRSDGVVVYEGRGPRLDVSALPAGSYYLRLRSESGAESLRFIKE